MFQSLRLYIFSFILLIFGWMGIVPMVQAQSASDVTSIEDAREADEGSSVTVEAIVTRAGGRFLRFEDDTAGLTSFQTSGAQRNAIDSGALAQGDSIRISGTLGEFAEQLQISPSEFNVLSRENDLPEPQVITLSDLEEDGLNFESRLVRIESLTSPQAGQTFSAGSNYEVEDATGTGPLRTPENSEDPGIVGQLIPADPFIFEGVIARFNDQFQLWPLRASDIRAEEEADVDLSDILICQIQGSGQVSPFYEESITTYGNIVTTVDNNGFFMQMPGPHTDCPDRSSRGVFVFTQSTPGVAVGDEVTVSGDLDEYFEWTQISNSPNVSTTASNQEVPDPVQFDSETPSPEPSGVPDIARYESMLVQVDGGIVTGPTNNFGVSQVDAGGSIDTSRNYRGEGALYPGVPGEPDLPVWDGNQHIFSIEPGELSGGAGNVELARGSTVSNATGPLTYRFEEFRLWPMELETEAANPVGAIRAPEANEMLIATFNLYDLFHPDEHSDTTHTSFNRHLDKLSEHICDLLHTPAVIGVQELSGPLSLDGLTDAVEDQCDVAYDGYAFDDTNDPRGIRSGVMARAEVVDVETVEMWGDDEQLDFTNNVRHDRPPIYFYGYIDDDIPLHMLVVHNRSRIGLEDSEFAQRKRLEQGQSIARMVQDIQEEHDDPYLTVVGDFNAFEFTDAYADVVQQITGSVELGRQLWEESSPVDPVLTNRVTTLDPEDRYSYVFEGNAQVLDHILTSESLDPYVTHTAYARANADAPRRRHTDGGTVERSSDHDALAIYLDIGDDGGPVEPDPTQFEIRGNAPNPFSDATMIRFDLPERMHVSIRVLDALGREVAVLTDEEMNEGAHEVEWNPNVHSGSASSGVYFFQLDAGEHSATGEMVLIR